MRCDDDHDIYHEVTVVGGGRRYFTHSTAPLADKDAYRQSVRGCKVHLPDPYSQRYHSFGKSHGLGLADAIIAATSQIENADLATLNTKHYPMIARLKSAYSKK